MKEQPTRLRQLNTKATQKGPVLYWMRRDFRARDNWALIEAQRYALENEAPLHVLVCVPRALPLRRWQFLCEGLVELASDLESKNIALHICVGEPHSEVMAACEQLKVGKLVTDFSPLRGPRSDGEALASQLDIAVVEVDAHNVVPCWVASPKLEFAAYTLRPKIHRLLTSYLTELPTIKKHPYASEAVQIDFAALARQIKIDVTVPGLDAFKGGEKAAQEALKQFIAQKLSHYDNDRNDPTKDAQSDLSPYLNFGQISAQRVALEVMKTPHAKAKESFLEELIVRRELADNFCLYNPNYDRFEGFWDWAKRTLSEHEGDERPYLYSLREFEEGATHDPLWNAAQYQMVHHGKMHGYMRMFWAKKILEWSKSPREALQIALWLNDKYELDGCDPNGYCGVAWSIGGVHDRAWFDRPVFGKIRFMSANGCKSKFVVADYVSRFSEESRKKTRPSSRGQQRLL